MNCIQEYLSRQETVHLVSIQMQKLRQRSMDADVIVYDMDVCGSCVQPGILPAVGPFPTIVRITSGEGGRNTVHYLHGHTKARA